MFLKVTNTIDQSEFIVEYPYSFEENATLIFKSLKDTSRDFEYSVSGKICSIYKKEKITKKGYVWNSYSYKSINYYTVTEIACKNTIQKEDKCVSTEPSFAGIEELPEEIQTHAQIKKQVLSELKQKDYKLKTPFSDIPSRYSQEFANEIFMKLKSMREKIE